MSVNVVNTNPRDGGTLIQVSPGVVQALGTFDKTATIEATLVSGSSTWNANEDGNKFVLLQGQPTVQWAVTFGPPGGVAVPRGLHGCTLTVTGTASDGSGSGTSVITVSTPVAAVNGRNNAQVQRDGQAKKGAAQQKTKAAT